MSEHNEYQPNQAEMIEKIITEIDHLALHGSANETTYDTIYYLLKDFNDINGNELTQELITSALNNLARYNSTKESMLQAKEALAEYHLNTH